jgi:hypothetical protein
MQMTFLEISCLDAIFKISKYTPPPLPISSHIARVGDFTKLRTSEHILFSEFHGRNVSWRFLFIYLKFAHTYIKKRILYSKYKFF